MSLKFNYINSHLDFLPANLGAFFDERSEKIH